jgi:hypothetical protein
MGLTISCSFWIGQFCCVRIWIASQNYVSSTCWQISQILSLTILFLIKFVLHWILPFDNSHVKNWTLGGALFFQTKFAHGSSLELANFSVT